MSADQCWTNTSLWWTEKPSDKARRLKKDDFNTKFTEVCVQKEMNMDFIHKVRYMLEILHIYQR